MRKKVTNEEVAKTIGELADKIRSEMDFDFRVAYGQMCLAENDLSYTFNEEQKKLYKDFCEKREAFYALASDMYKRKI
ncbi:MAG: hypothetical protein E7373_02545 [Clostridiales bacterium]|nr:hypothetical protein [Clostridiales bacterium]